MEENSKGAEVRARVMQAHFDALSRIATDRGEQLPVILREAIAEYLAKRVAGGGEPEVLAALRDQPDVLAGLRGLGRLLAANSSPGQAAAVAHLGALAGAAAPGAATPAKRADKPTSYAAPRRKVRKPKP